MKSRHFILDAAIIFLCTFLVSLGINIFLSGAQLLSGGFTGIALILQYLFNIPSGIVVFLLNIPLFFISYKFLNRKFTINSAVGMICISACLIITKPLSSILSIDDILLRCIYGGSLCGLGYGIIFLRNGSVGGTDIIAMLIRKKNSNFNIGALVFSMNIVIVIVGALIFGVNKALYTLISMFAQSIVLDNVIRILSTKKLMIIITSREDHVIDFIMSDLHRTVTSVDSTGEFTHENRKMLYCVATANEMITIKNEILLRDPNAFINVLDISEVKGGGFSSI